MGPSTPRVSAAVSLLSDNDLPSFVLLEMLKEIKCHKREKTSGAFKHRGSFNLIYFNISLCISIYNNS